LIGDLSESEAVFTIFLLSPTFYSTYIYLINDIQAIDQR